MQRLREWPARADWGKAEAPASRFPRLTLPRECKGPFYHPAPRNDMWPAVSNRFLVTPKKMGDTKRDPSQGSLYVDVGGLDPSGQQRGGGNPPFKVGTSSLQYRQE